MGEVRASKVAVLDAGLGNLGSIEAALTRLGCSWKRLPCPPDCEESDQYTHAVLPGVGSFKAGMDRLADRRWDRWISTCWAPSGRPLLGVCLGMQLMAASGTEGAGKFGGTVKGLGLIDGSVDRMPQSPGFRLPHIGWNSVKWRSLAPESPFQPPQSADYYFVNSYVFTPLEDSTVLAEFDYGNRYCAAVGQGSVLGVQFHPEKSQRAGMIVLRKFLETQPC